jgi:DNA repair exonuclease SbcCD ATPase subunit
MEELRAIHARLEAAAAAAEAEVVAVPADFERALGMALRKQLDGVGVLRLLELLQAWDPERTGLKRVDFRRHVRTGLKLSGATNAELDRVFDEVTGGGGAALAAPKALKPRLEKALERAATPEPLVAALEQRAAAKRGALAPVERAIEALAAVHEAEALEEAQRERAVLAARRTAAALQAAVVEAEKARAAEEAAAKEAAALKERDEELATLATAMEALTQEKRESDARSDENMRLVNSLEKQVSVAEATEKALTKKIEELQAEIEEVRCARNTLRRGLADV